MNTVKRISILVGSIIVQMTPAIAQPVYDFVMIDSWNANPLAGEAYVWDINDSNIAVGIASMDNRIGTPGYAWTLDQGKVEVPVSSPQSVSEGGLVVGIGGVYDLDTQTYTALPSLPSTYFSPLLYGVTATGTAVGTISGCSCSDSGGVTNVAYIWDEIGGARTLPVPVLHARGLRRVNSSNMAIGWLHSNVLNEGFVIDLNSGWFVALTNVMPPTVGTGYARANDINDADDVVGTVPGVLPVSQYGYIYNPARGASLLPLPGAGYQQSLTPTGISNSGVIVGWISTMTASQRAFVLSPGDVVRDLNNPALVAGIPSGYTLHVAQKVNNLGWIVGNGSKNGKNTGWVLIPRGPTCDSIDYNRDGLFPDTQDIDDFISVFAGGSCSTGNCNDLDFNNDGLFPDTADLDALLRVFMGGPC